MRKLTAMVAAVTMIVAMAPVSLGAATPALTGEIRGVVIENSGRPLGISLQAQLVNSQGVAGMTTVVARDGAFAFNNVAPGLYTVQILGAKGMSAVNVTAGRVAMANVTVAVPVAPKAQAAGGLSTAAKWLIALAAIGGGTVIAVVATRNEASGSK